VSRFIIKIGLSIVAIVAFIVPEAASSVSGLAALFAIWGIDWGEGGGA
jgi:hypothetical protein